MVSVKKKSSTFEFKINSLCTARSKVKDGKFVIFYWIELKTMKFILWQGNKFKIRIRGHHHHHVAPPTRISLTLSRHFSLSFIASGRSSGLHPVSSHSCCM